MKVESRETKEATAGLNELRAEISERCKQAEVVRQREDMWGRMGKLVQREKRSRLKKTTLGE